MNDYKQINISPKNLTKYIIIGVISVIALVLFFMSWSDVDPGEQGFIYRPYGGGVDKEKIYNEGTIFIAPWNEMITYNTRQQSKSWNRVLY